MIQSVRFLRIIAFVEALSFLLLLFVAMPMKYLGNIPTAVSMPGKLHGAFFVLFIAALAWAAYVKKWPLKIVIGIFASSLVPFVPFFVDRWLRKEEIRS